MPSVIQSSLTDSQIIYTLPPRQSFRLLGASCRYDTTGFGAAFMPQLEVDASDGSQLFLFGSNIRGAAADIVFVTYAPHCTPPSPVIGATNYSTETGLPELPLEPGMALAFFVSALNTPGPVAGVVISDMSLYIESTSGDEAGLGFGPFMFVPGPGA